MSGSKRVNENLCIQRHQIKNYTIFFFHFPYNNELSETIIV